MIRNNESNTNILVNNLGKATGTEINLIANIYILEYNLDSDLNKSMKKDNFEKYVIKDYTCLLGKSEIFIFDVELKSLEFLIPFTSISEVIIDTFLPYCFILKLNQSFEFELNNKNDDNDFLDKSMNHSIVKISNKNKFDEKEKVKLINNNEMWIYLKNRTGFIKSLICYYNTFILYETNQFRELLIRYEKVQHLKRVFITTSTKIKHNPPFEYEEKTLENYTFFISKTNQRSVNNIYFLNVEHEEEYLNTNISVFIDKEKSIESINLNLQQSALDFMNFYLNKLEFSNYWIFESYKYLKKYNINDDIAQWECWKIITRVKIKDEYENFIIYYIRRKFIPPLFDVYQEIKIVLNEKYNSSYNNLKISDHGEITADTIVDSLHSIEENNTLEEFKSFLNSKIDTLLLDFDSYDFYLNSLKIRGKFIYKFGYMYMYSMLLLLENSLHIEFNECKNHISMFCKLNGDNLEKYINKIRIENISPKEIFEKLNDLNSIFDENYFDVDLIVKNKERLPTQNSSSNNNNQSSKHTSNIEIIKRNSISKNKESENSTENEISKIPFFNAALNTKIQYIWSSKIKYFFTYTLNGGFFYKFNLDYIFGIISDYYLETNQILNNINKKDVNVDVKKKNSDNNVNKENIKSNKFEEKIKILNSENFNSLIMEIYSLLDFHIITKQNTKEGDRLKLSFYISQSHNIKEVKCNIELMMKLIRFGLAKKVLGIKDNFSYTSLLNFIIENYFSSDLLDSILYYLKSLTKITFEIDKINSKKSNEDMSIENVHFKEHSEERSSYVTIMSSLLNKFLNVKTNALILVKLSQIFCVITGSPQDKIYWTKLLHEEILNGLTFYFSYPNEMLIFNCLRLIINIKEEIQENISDILSRYEKIVDKLVNLFNGTKIPGGEYSLNIVILACQAICILIKFSPVALRDLLNTTDNILCLENSFRYLDNEFYPLVNRDNYLMKADLRKNELKISSDFNYFYSDEELLNLRTNLYIVNDFIIRNNNSLKKYLTANNFLQFLIKISKEEYLFLSYLVSGTFQFTNQDDIKIENDQNVKKRIETINAMLKFTFYYFASNREAILLLKEITSGNYFLEAINVINQNKTFTLFEELLKPVGSIIIQINNSDEAEE